MSVQEILILLLVTVTAIGVVVSFIRMIKGTNCVDSGCYFCRQNHKRIIKK